MLIPLALAALTSGYSLQASATPINQKKIHQEYQNGDFDIAAKDLETYEKENHGKNWSRDDSIFLNKHLAVIYTATRETREKGKYHMIEMLKIMPSAEILDMYVSEEVDRIFLRIREEFMANMRLLGVDTTNMNVPKAIAPNGTVAGKQEKAIPTPAPDSKPVAKQDAAIKIKPVLWVAGGLVAVAAAGVSTYFILNGHDKTEHINSIPVPKN